MKNNNVKTISVKIVTPERTVYEGLSDSISLPTKDGQVTVLPKHVSYISILVPGEVIVRNGKEEISMAVSGGFIEFDKNKLVVLADTAERAEELDAKKAEEAKKRAEKLKKQVFVSDETEYAQVTAAVEKELARVRVARKHHSKKGVRLGV